MIDRISDICCGCGVCERVCPTKCIEMQMNREGFFYPRVNKEICADCNVCEQVCPIINPIKKECDNSCVTVRATDESILKKGASGGFFTLLAKEFIINGGTVCGAIIDDSMKIVHVLTENPKDVYRFSGSKYVQSDLTGCYEIIKNKLESRNMVLFSGTPCQVQAIKKYINNDELLKRLTTLDVVCKGVGSPGVWSDYLKYMEAIYESSIDGVYFRKKTYGYHSPTLEMLFSNGKVYSKNKTDLFLRAYVNELCSREACYHCQFKGIDRCSDFTVFDAWNANCLGDIEDDDKGYTNVIVHTEQARKIIEKLKETKELEVYDVSMMDAIAIDGKMVEQQPISNPVRKDFLEDTLVLGILKASRKYFPVTWKDYLIEISKPLLYKLNLLKIVKKLNRKMRW